MASHSQADFNASYSGVPPWDIGRPQATFQKLADRGALKGRVLDVGCGTGEHTFLAARLGLDATGVDYAPAAIVKAQEKAAQRGLKATFVEGDARHLETLGRQFDSVLDCGLFHVLSDEDRAAFVKSVSAVVPPGGQYFMLCFSERLPGEGGPRRITQAEIRESFQGWRVESIEPVDIEVTFSPGSVPAWLAHLVRVS